LVSDVTSEVGERELRAAINNLWRSDIESFGGIISEIRRRQIENSWTLEVIINPAEYDRRDALYEEFYETTGLRDEIRIEFELVQNELYEAVNTLRENPISKYPDGVLRGSGITRIDRDTGETSVDGTWFLELYAIFENYDDLDELYKKIYELTGLKQQVMIKPWLGPTPLA